MNAFFLSRAVVGAILLVLGTLLSTEASVAQPAPYRPLVFVPGILGTELLDESGSQVWGGAASLSRFSELEVTEKGPVKILHAGGLIKQINLLGPLWTIHQYDGLLKTLQTLNYKEGVTLFVFPYDWRLSNFQTAEKLKAFIDNEPRLRNQKFDILAHSMGGLVSRIYVRNFGGAARVERLISLGVPAQGAMNSLATMVEGWGKIQNALAGGLNPVRRVLFSFPSLYELFPSYADCCRIGNESDYQAFDPMDIAVWKQNDWLPIEYRNAPRIQLVEQALDGARKLRMLVREPLNVQHTMFVGDRLGTYLYLYVDRTDHSWNKWRFSKNRGDGTVPVWSAANGVLGDGLPSFVAHATIFDDKWVVNKLEWMLDRNSGPPPVAATNSTTAVTRAARQFEVKLVDVTFDPQILEVAGKVTMAVQLDLGARVTRDEIVITGNVVGRGAQQELTLVNVTENSDLRLNRLRFAATIDLPAPGVYTVNTDIPGLGTYSKDLAVLGQ
jgi:pimeloyl-ACP methyl ester carboxylesterase